MNQRADDPSPLKVDRVIPMPWLLTGIGSVIVSAVMMWTSIQTQSQTLRDLTLEVRELRTSAAQGGLEVVKMGAKIDDHERRIVQLETKRP